MKEKIRIIEVDSGNSQIMSIKEQFAYRFGYDVSREDVQAFKNRVISAIANVIGNDEYNLKRYTSIIFKLLGYSYVRETEFLFRGSLLHQALQRIDIKSGNDKLYLLLQILELIINNIPESDDTAYTKKYWFAQDIAEALKISGINAVICETDDGYKFYPYSEKIFDKALVIEVLNWLSTYNKAKEQYQNALDYMLKGQYDRQAADCLRLALELFMKQFLNNDKPLEKQVSCLGTYLKGKNMSVEIANMYVTLIDYYTKYNNNHSKHDSSVDENEMDFLLYLTGSFIRLLVRLQ